MTYICTCVCAFTKYAVAIPLSDKSAVTVARAIIENAILKLGCCDVIVTDNGKEFENALFRELCRGLEILKALTTFYNSRSNGLVERFHRSLNAMLGKVVHMHQTDWPDHLPFVLNAYNTTVHYATGFSPHFLMFGREQRIPVDVSLGNPRRDQKTVSEYAKLLLDRMKQAHDLVRQRLQRYSERMRKRYNVSVNEWVFAPG